MPSSELIGALLAIISAIVWGAGDFSGGIATRRGSQFQVLALAAASGIVVLVILAGATSEAPPTAASAGWAALAGISGGLGIAALYQGLARGSAAVIAPTTSVVGTALPVIFSSLTEGLPGSARLSGFVLALAGIWLVSRGRERQEGAGIKGLWLALLAGIGFGGFFILIAQVAPGSVFAPLVIAKIATLALALAMLAYHGQPLAGPAGNPIALLAGVLDAGGNIFFLLAKQLTRLDIASVLASLYAAATVILARTLLRERISQPQWAGVVLCTIAIGLIVA